MPAPKNPESYSITYHKIAQFCMENPLESLEFEFSERGKAMTFRRNLYGYISALDKKTKEKKTAVPAEELESLKRRLDALRARKITMEEGVGRGYKINMIPRDLEELSSEVEEQLAEQWEKIREEDDTSGEEGETTDLHQGIEEGEETATERTIREQFGGARQD